MQAVDVPAWAVTALLDADRPSTEAAVAALVAARLLDRHGADDRRLYGHGQRRGRIYRRGGAAAIDRPAWT